MDACPSVCACACRLVCERFASCLSLLRWQKLVQLKDSKSNSIYVVQCSEQCMAQLLRLITDPPSRKTTYILMLRTYCLTEERRRHSESKLWDHPSKEEGYDATQLPPTMLCFHPFPGDLTNIHTGSLVIPKTPTSVVYTCAQGAPHTHFRLGSSAVWSRCLILETLLCLSTIRGAGCQVNWV